MNLLRAPMQDDFVGACPCGRPKAPASRPEGTGERMPYCFDNFHLI